MCYVFLSHAFLVHFIIFLYQNYVFNKRFCYVFSTVSLYQEVTLWLSFMVMMKFLLSYVIYCQRVFYSKIYLGLYFCTSLLRLYACMQRKIFSSCKTEALISVLRSPLVFQYKNLNNLTSLYLMYEPRVNIVSVVDSLLVFQLIAIAMANVGY